MRKNHILTIIIAMIMLFSGLAVLVTAQEQGNGGQNASASAPAPASHYQVTLKANGLLSSPRDLSNWTATLYGNTSYNPFNVVGKYAYTNVTRGTYYYVASDFYQSLSTSGNRFTVTSNLTIYVNFSTPHRVTFNAPFLASNISWGVHFSSSSTPQVYNKHPTVRGGQSDTFYMVPQMYGGTYSFTSYLIQNGNNYSMGQSNIYVNDTNYSINLPMNAFSNVTFTPSNLPYGTTWFVLQNGGPEYQYYPGGVVFYTSARTFKASIEGGPGSFSYGYVSGSRLIVGNFSLDASATHSYSLKFPQLANVTFGAPNLPTSATGWGLSGNFTFANTNDTFGVAESLSTPAVILLPKTDIHAMAYATLGISAGGTGSSYSVSSSQFNVETTGNVQTVNVPFSHLEQVSLKLSGLPSNVFAVVNSYGEVLSGYHDNVTLAPVSQMLLPNGTYQFLVDLSGSTSNEALVNITVHGTTQKTVELFKATFTSSDSRYEFRVEAPIPLGGFYVYRLASAPGTSVIAYLTNGTYSYTVSEYAGHSNAFLRYERTLKIEGSNANIVTNFPTTFENVTVNVKGIPSSLYWRIDAYSNQPYISAYTNYTEGSASWIWLPVGSYKFFLDHLVENSTSTFNANETGFNVTAGGQNIVSLYGTGYNYIDFRESGLPAGTSWSVSIDSRTFTSTGTEMYAPIPYGNLSKTYTYTIGKISGYSATPASGNIFLPLSYYFDNYFRVSVSFLPDSVNYAGSTASTLSLSNHSLHPGFFLNSKAYISTGPIVVDSANGNTYVSYAKESSSTNAGIQIYNSTTYAYKGTIDLPPGFQVSDMIIDTSSGNLIFAASTQYGSYYFVGTVNLETMALQIEQFNFYIGGMALDTKNNVLYVATNSGLYGMNPATLSYESAVSLPVNIPGGDDPYLNSAYNVIYDSSSGMLYVTGLPNYSIQEINPATSAIVGNFSFVYTPGMTVFDGGAVMDAANGYIYLQVTEYNRTANQSFVEVFSPQTGKFVNRIATSSGWNFQIALNPVTGDLYVPLDTSYLDARFLFSNGLGVGNVLEISTATGKVLSDFKSGLVPDSVAINQKTGAVLTGSFFGGDVTINTPGGTYGYLTGKVSDKKATVTVDGKSVQVVNGVYNVTVSPGTYYITAFGNGYSTVTLPATVAAYMTTTENIQMSQSTTYEVSGHVSPGSASVLLNGASANVNSTTGDYSIYVAAGNYTLSAFEQGYFPFSENINVSGNRQVSITLAKEPAPTSVVSGSHITGDGFNLTLSNLSTAGGNISLDFNATSNGTLTVQVPFSDLSNVNVSDILHSRVYVNGVEYSNFTVSISSNYTVVLTVTGLNGDPQLVWVYNPANSPLASTPPPNHPGGSNILLYGAIIGAIAVIAVVAIVLTQRRKPRN